MNRNNRGLCALTYPNELNRPLLSNITRHEDWVNNWGILGLFQVEGAENKNQGCCLGRLFGYKIRIIGMIIVRVIVIVIFLDCKCH